MCLQCSRYPLPYELTVGTVFEQPAIGVGMLGDLVLKIPEDSGGVTATLIPAAGRHRDTGGGAKSVTSPRT